MKYLIDNEWYPILRSRGLRRRPVALDRLGMRIVVWRAAGGVSAAPAACPHRGADLGEGRVHDQCLVCPYHGIRYRSDGTALLRPAAGAGAPIPESAHLRLLSVREEHGFIWLWHGPDIPSEGPRWFDAPAPSTTVGADQIWVVHYSRFVESALDFHHVPFVHRRYVPGLGPVVRDVTLDHDRHRFAMRGVLTTEDGRRPVGFSAEVMMPCVLRVVAAGTTFVATGTPVDDERTFVAALYEPHYASRWPLLRTVEASLAMLMDFKLFQRQDRAILEGLPPGPSRLDAITPMPADRGSMAWIREWQHQVEPTPTPPQPAVEDQHPPSGLLAHPTAGVVNHTEQNTDESHHATPRGQK